MAIKSIERNSSRPLRVKWKDCVSFGDILISEQLIKTNKTRPPDSEILVFPRASLIS